MSRANEQREAPELEAKVTFRLTPEEKRKLQADADSLGVSLGALVRRLCAEGTGRARPKSQRVASPGDVLIAKELNRVGNNLNHGWLSGFVTNPSEALYKRILGGIGWLVSIAIPGYFILLFIGWLNERYKQGSSVNLEWLHKIYKKVKPSD